MAKPTAAHDTEPPDAFRLAFDAAPIGMALVALEGRWLRVNAALCELTGYSEAELLQGRFQDITHPDDLDVDLEYVRQVLARERSSYRMEKRYVRKDGQVVHCSLSVSLARDAAGNALGFVSQIEDISDRRRMIAELEQRGRLMDLAHDAILIRDATDATVTYWNHQAEAVYGYAASAALGRISHDLLQTEFPESQQAIDAALLERGRWDGELCHTRQDGRRILVASRQSLERGPDGEPRAIIELNSDITEARAAEHALGVAQARHQRVVEALAEGVVLFDEEGRNVQTNPAAARMIGMSSENAVGASVSDPRWRLVREDGTEYAPDDLPA